MLECSVDLAELTDDGSVVPVAADEDIHYDYNLIKAMVWSHLAVIFEDNFSSVFSCGQRVLPRHFFLRKNLINFTFKLEAGKWAAILSGTVRHVGRDLVSKSKETKRRELFINFQLHSTMTW